MISAAHLFQHYSSAPRYNTKAVVSETGVPSDTFRAWERRYGVPSPQRADGGQRLYSERDIAIIRWLRDRTNEGMTISQAVALLHTAEHIPAPAELPRSCEAIRHDIVRMLLHFDGSGAEELLNEAFALYTLASVCLNIIQPTLVEIGERWHSGEASIAQEHFATQFLRRKLLALLNTYDVAAGRATVIAACAPGEFHDTGLLLLTLFLVRHFYKVVYLGPDVPYPALQQVVLQLQPQLACISATTLVTADAALLAAQNLCAVAPGTAVVIGGQGFAQDPSLPGIHYLNHDAVAAAEYISMLLASRHNGG